MTLSGFGQDFKTWLQHPFSTDMNALGWFKFFGLVIAINVIYVIILAHIRRALES